MAITLKSVANEAGVSVRTAGRVLRGGGPVSGATAERVRKAAARLSYVPNAAARNLRRRSCRIVGVITSDGNHELIHTRLRILERCLREAGRDTLLGSLPGTQEELERMLLEWTGFADFVIFTNWNPDFCAERLLKLPIRCIFLDRDPGSDKFDRVLTERASGVREVILALIRSGAGKIAHVSGIGSSGGRIEGFDSAIRAQPKVKAVRIPSKGSEFADGYRLGARILRSGADGVFFDTDRMALGFYRYAHEHGIRIPEQIAVAGFDNDTPDAYAIPSLSTVAHPLEEEVREAVRLVTNGDRKGKPKTLYFPTKLIVRESIPLNVKPIKQSPTFTGK